MRIFVDAGKARYVRRYYESQNIVEAYIRATGGAEWVQGAGGQALAQRDKERGCPP